jgi:hypothetical protein
MVNGGEDDDFSSLLERRRSLHNTLLTTRFHLFLKFLKLVRRIVSTSVIIPVVVVVSDAALRTLFFFGHFSASFGPLIEPDVRVLLLSHRVWFGSKLRVSVWWKVYVNSSASTSSFSSAVPLASTRRR